MLKGVSGDTLKREGASICSSRLFYSSPPYYLPCPQQSRSSGRELCSLWLSRGIKRTESQQARVRLSPGRSCRNEEALPGAGCILGVPWGRKEQRPWRTVSAKGVAIGRAAQMGSLQPSQRQEVKSRQDL